MPNEQLQILSFCIILQKRMMIYISFDFTELRKLVIQPQSIFNQKKKKNKISIQKKTTWKLPIGNTNDEAFIWIIAGFAGFL